MKQKKKNQTVNNKFNFDDEYIIGFSNSNNVPKKGKKNKSKVKKKKKNNVKKTDNRNVKKPAARPKMNEKRRKVRNRFVKIFLIIVLLVGAGCFLCLSPMFNVQEIIVQENTKIASDTISSLSGIQLYKNIFLFNKSDAIENIQKNSYIESVKISRSLPNKIKITVKERSEKYLVEFAEGKYVSVDGQGYVLEIVEVNDNNLPILTGIKTDTETLINIENNQVRLCEEDLKKLDTVANIIETAKNYDVNGYITKIDISDGDDYKLILAGENKTVYLGNCSDLNTRILFMKEILNSEKGKKGEMFINEKLSEKPPYFREAVN